MNTPRVHPEYGLEIVVSDDQVNKTGQIIAATVDRWTPA